MNDLPAQMIEVANGARIACRYQDGRGPCLVFLPGYMSDMLGGKAEALSSWAVQNDSAMLRLDYSGCGESDGDFADGSLSRWRDEVLQAITYFAEGKQIILVGSSMGGWLMLLVAAELGEGLAGMIGIAAAPDFTEWGFDEEQKQQLAQGKTIFEENPYGPDPTPTHAKFWRDGESLKLLGQEIAIDCPTRLLHGQRDEDVPWEISLRLAAALRSDDVQVTLIKDGDHRLSRPEDIDILIATAAHLLQN